MRNVRSSAGWSLASLALLVVAGLALQPGSAEAQSTANGSASINIPTVLFIDVTNTTVNFSDPTASDFNTGNIQASASSDLTYRANVAHDVTIAADASNFSGGSGSKPAGDLQWSQDGGSTWNSFSSTAEDIVTNAAQGAHNSAKTIDYRVLLDYSTDSPGDYTLNFTYSVVAN